MSDIEPTAATAYVIGADGRRTPVLEYVGWLARHAYAAGLFPLAATLDVHCDNIRRLCRFLDAIGHPDLIDALRLFQAWDTNPHATEADAAALRRAVADALAKATTTPDPGARADERNHSTDHQG